MRVVLLERIERLGRVGEVVEVRDGYGRNWLIPQKKALRATKANLEYFEHKKEDFEKRNEDLKKEAEIQASNLKNLEIIMILQAQSSGVLYGSVSVKDIVSYAESKGYKIEKAKVILPKPIKEVGVHIVKIALHPEVVCELKVYIGSTQEEISKLKNPHAHEKKMKKKIEGAETQGESEVEEVTNLNGEEEKVDAKTE